MTYAIDIRNVSKRKWEVQIPGCVLGGHANWVAAKECAIGIALAHGPRAVITLYKINGTVQTIKPRSKAASAPQAIVEGDEVFIARVSKSIDHDPDKERVVDTLEAAIKALPRKAHGLAWNVTPFDSHKLDDGRIVSIERTTN